MNPEVVLRVEHLSPGTTTWASVLYGPGGKVVLRTSSEKTEARRTAERVAEVLRAPMIVAED